MNKEEGELRKERGVDGGGKGVWLHAIFHVMFSVTIDTSCPST